MAHPTSRQDKPTTTPPSESTALLLLGTIGDTTWRMFVPTIGLALLGDYLDNTLATRPWLMLAGAAVGAAIAAWLVKRQLTKVR